MRLLDLTLPTPEENLALDEALLLAGEEAGSGEWLRFWESPRHFVVLGVAAKLQMEVNTAACEEDAVPILRRSSGGGTVLQGPGCLNFSLVLSLESRLELRHLHQSYAAILERTAAGLALPGIARQGISDLALGELKFSGNAQKRTRRTLLHHGTILHAFDLARVERCLREPENQPEYRCRRPHASFLRNLPLPLEEIKARLARAWEACVDDSPPPLPPIEGLLETKYHNRAWNERF